MPAFEFSLDNVAKITDFVGNKQPPKVVRQTPAPGTPVLQGMTIEVHVVSYSDVPLQVLDVAAPPPIRTVPIAEIEKVIADDPMLRKAAAEGTVTPTEAALFIQKITTGLAGRGFTVTGLTANDSAGLARSFNQLGFR